MEAHEAIQTLEVGDKITIDGHTQTFTVTNVMFGGEMVEIEGPRGGEKCLTQNVNSGSVGLTAGSTDKGNVSTITVC